MVICQPNQKFQAELSRTQFHLMKKAQVKWEDVAGDARFRDIWQDHKLGSGPEHDKISTRQALRHVSRTRSVS